MKHIYAFVFALIVLSILITSKLMAAELLWEMPAAGPVTVELGPTPTGPFTTIATIPQGTTRFLLTPGQWGHYRVSNAAGPSNTAQYAMDVYSDTVTGRLTVLEDRVTALETPVVEPPPPAPVSTFTITHIDATHIRIVCNGIGITTSGSGTSRTMECRQ
jgi:hypothetical protein